MEAKKRWDPDSLMRYGSLLALLNELDQCEIKPFQRYKEVKRFLKGKARETGTPLIGMFELTPLCNLDCRMCYIHLTPAQMKERKLLPVETWGSLIDQAVDAGMLYAAVTGGECLTYPGFWEVYRHLQSRGTEVELLTNGTLLTEEAVRRLKDNPPAAIQISLYGSDEDAYERVTGRRAFAQAMEGIRRVVDADIAVSIAVTPSAYMTDDLKKILPLVREMGLLYNINSIVFEARDNTQRAKADYDLALDDYVEILKYDAELNGRALRPCDEEDVAGQGAAEGEPRTGLQCGAGRCAFAIAWDGRMRGCNSLDSLSAYPLEEGFLPAWRKLNKAAREYPLPVECFGCAYKPVCQHCVAAHEEGAARGHANPAVCACGKRLVREGLRVLGG